MVAELSDGRARVIASLLALAAVMILAQRAAQAADGERQLDAYISAGAEFWPTPDAGGHGWLLAGISVDELPGDGRFVATFNTETLALDYSDVRLAESWRAGFRIKGELGFAHLMPDYYRRGELLASRGFSASYIEAHAHTKWLMAPYQSLELHLDARRWFFDELDATSPQLILPEDRFEVTPSVRYVYWELEDDPSIGQMHRPFWRVRGVAFGLTASGTWRSDDAAWGARAPSFEPRDLRNNPDRLSPSIDQWFRAGRQFMPDARIEFSEWAGWSEGVDDLGRNVLGGMNPFVIPVAGLPWASLVSERYLVAQSSFHFRILGDVEAGVLVDAAGASDIRRTGDADRLGFAAGFGAFVDARLDTWQADLRLGWSPDFNWQAHAPHTSVLISAGKSF
ncbi:MAG: hypothetical protein ACQEVA_09800 [Myxococcota bacterium]